MLPANLLSHCTNLTGLLFDSNHITAIPPDFLKHQVKLVGLGLQSNQIEMLPQGIFDSLSHLTSLDMANNSITQLPHRLFDNNPALTFISMGSNRVSGEQEAELFAKQTQLLSLNISYNEGLWFPDTRLGTNVPPGHLRHADPATSSHVRQFGHRRSSCHDQHDRV